MKKLKIFLMFILFTCLIMCNNVHVEAKEYPLSIDQKIFVPFVWYGKDGIKMSDEDKSSEYNTGIAIYHFNIDGQRKTAFCIQHRVYTDKQKMYQNLKGSDYWDNVISEESKNNIRIAMDWYMNAEEWAINNGRQYNAYQAAMQAYVWEMTLNDWKNGGEKGQVRWDIAQDLINRQYNTPSEGNWLQRQYNTVKPLYDTLVQYVADHQVGSIETPVFNNTSLTLSPGQSASIYDTTGSFANDGWTIDKSNLPVGVNVDKNGNTINISIDSNYSQGVWNGDIKVKYNAPASSSGREEIVFFTSEEHKGYPLQQLIHPGSPRPQSVEDQTAFSLEILPGKIHLEKQDKESGIKAQGDATLVGAIYGVYDSTGKEVDRLTIGEDRTASTKYLPLGVYTVKELVPPRGYGLSDEVYTIEIKSSSLEPTLTVYDNVTKGDIRIYKRLGETDYDPEIPLAGAKFKVVLKSAIGTEEEASKTYETNTSGTDGICKIEGLPYGEYVVKEVVVPDEAYIISDFEVNIEAEKTYDETKVDNSKMMKIAVNKKLLDETVGKTDAEVSGAYFTVYTDAAATKPFIDKNGRVVRVGPTNKDGYAISGTMRTGTYYLKETTFPEGINPKALVPGEDVTYEDKIYEASYDNRKQGTDVVIINFEKLVNIPNFGRVRVIKYKDVNDKSEEIPAAGAKLRLTLVSSNGSVYYDGTVDETGYCEFIKEDVQYISPTYTIPYGKYELTELDEGGDLHKYYFIQPENIDIVNNEQDEKRIVADNPVPAWLKIIKKDRLTNLTVKLEGAEYAIWDLQENKFVEQMSYEDGGVISRYKTNSDGYLVTPEKVQPGEYVIYETNAPEGYFLQEEWRLPDNPSEYGKVGGKKIKVDKITTGLAEDTTYPEGGVVTGEIVLDTTIDDKPLTVNLELYKTGEKFTGAKTEKVTYPVSETENRDEDLYTPIYKELPLQGVGYRIYAVADTYTPDGIKRYSKDQMVADITTDENGYAVAEKLFPGEYRIEEYKTPKGYLKDENIPNVVLENKDQYLETATVKKELTDERQKLGLTFKKEYEEVKYSDEEELVQKSLFGVYTKETLNNYQGTATISRNSLVDLIWADSENNVISKADLPEGTYYVKELYVTYPYNIDTNTYDYNLAYSNNATEKVVIVRGKNIINTPTTTTLTLVKVGSTSSDEVVVAGNVIDKTNLDQKLQEVLNEMNGKTREEIKEYFKENNVRSVPGAEYGIYVDEACTKTLKVKNSETGKYEEVILTSDELGLIELEDIPVRTYYLKELKAPAGYEISKEIIKVELDNINNDGMVYNAMIEEEIVEAVITKKDIFTGELVPNCVFEIRDENGELILKSITNEKGEGYIPTVLFENGKTYTYTEVEAPEKYDLNKEPHPFVAEIGENYEWLGEKIVVDNIRKSKELRVLKVDDETGEPLKGCVFSIVLLDENGEPKTREDGSVVYLVENGVTDENGEYLIEKAYYGTYKFTEIEAPEGYEMNEESMEGYVFTIDENSPDRIDFIVTNTGDIAVIAISSILLISIVGIVYTLRKKYNEQ